MLILIDVYASLESKNDNSGVETHNRSTKRTINAHWIEQIYGVQKVLVDDEGKVVNDDNDSAVRVTWSRIRIHQAAAYDPDTSRNDTHRSEEQLHRYEFESPDTPDTIVKKINAAIKKQTPVVHVDCTCVEEEEDLKPKPAS